MPVENSFSHKEENPLIYRTQTELETIMLGEGGGGQRQASAIFSYVEYRKKHMKVERALQGRTEGWTDEVTEA